MTNVDETAIDKSVYRKNLRPVVYVTGDVAGVVESPVYAIFKMSDAIDKIQLPDGSHVQQYMGTALPERTDRYSMKWDGEWHITVEVFRDLGLAFAAVLVLIYVLVVGWFKSFITPLVIMAPIPLTLVGILPAHAAMGAFFTATSMIGFIAGAGIIVRNSIILVDFIELRRSHGMPLEEAVVDAGAVRFRPMLLTAAAVVVGASVILFDPIFQGLAISLMAGEVASTVLSRMTVPVLYYMSERGKCGNRAAAGGNFAMRKTKKGGEVMTVDRYLRLIAGAFVVVSVALGYWVNPYWFLFTGFRWVESISVGLHQLVPHDGHTAQGGREELDFSGAGFSLRGLVLARTKFRRLKPALRCHAPTIGGTFWFNFELSPIVS